MNKNELNNLIEQGIELEEYFSNIYFKLLKNSDFFESLNEANRKYIKKSFNLLIKESHLHYKALNKIKSIIK